MRSLVLILSLITATAVPRAHALVGMDNEAVDLALQYGMVYQEHPLQEILGHNWQLGERGALLNVYTPFMELATKAARANFPRQPTAEDLRDARGRFGNEVRFFLDPKERQSVKFSLSFFGDKSDFALDYLATITGYGRGKAVTLQPAKDLKVLEATPVESGGFEAINAYYFRFEELANLDTFTFTVTNKNNPADKYSFTIDNHKLF